MSRYHSVLEFFNNFQFWDPVVLFHEPKPSHRISLRLKWKIKMQNRTHNLFVSWRTSETLLSFFSLFEDELMIFAYVKLFALEKPFLESWSRLSLGNWLFNSFFHYQIILFTRGTGPMLSFLRLPTVDSPEKRNIQGDKTNGPTSSTDLAFLL